MRLAASRLPCSWPVLCRAALHSRSACLRRFTEQVAEALADDPAAYAAFQDVFARCRARSISNAAAGEQARPYLSLPSAMAAGVHLTGVGVSLLWLGSSEAATSGTHLWRHSFCVQAWDTLWSSRVLVGACA